MKILVCIKQVPDSAETLSINDSVTRIIYENSTVFRMNRYDDRCDIRGAGQSQKNHQ